MRTRILRGLPALLAAVSLAATALPRLTLGKDPAKEPAQQVSQAADGANDGNETPLKTYGSFNLPGVDAAKAQAELEAIVNRLREPGDPKFRIVFVNAPYVDAHVIFSLGGDKKEAEIHITQGFLASVKNESELAGVIAHEMSHPQSADALGRSSDLARKSQMQREEMIVADAGAVRRTRKAGFDPRGLREWLIRHSKAEARESGAFSFIQAFLTTHPVDEVRITKLDIELGQADKKGAFANPRPLSEAMAKVQQSKPTPTPEKKPEPKPEPQFYRPTVEAVPDPVKVTNDALIKKILEDPNYQKATPEEKLKLWRAFAVSEGVRFEFAGYFFSTREYDRKDWPGTNFRLDTKHMDEAVWHSNHTAKTSKGFEYVDAWRDYKHEITDNAAMDEFVKVAKSKGPKFLEQAVELVAEVDVDGRMGGRVPLIAFVQNQLRPLVPAIKNIADYRQHSEKLTLHQRMMVLVDLLKNSKEEETLVGFFAELRGLNRNLRTMPYEMQEAYQKRLTEIALLMAKRGMIKERLGLNWPTTNFLPNEKGVREVSNDDYFLVAESKALKEIALLPETPPAVKFIIIENQLAIPMSMEFSRSRYYGSSDIDPVDQKLYDEYKRILADEMKTPEDFLRLHREMKALGGDSSIRNRSWAMRDPAPFGVGNGVFQKLLDQHPEWVFTYEQILEIAGDTNHWPHGYSGLKNFTGAKDNHDLMRMLRDKLRGRDARDLADSVYNLSRSYNGPAYEYDTLASQRIQKRLLDGLQKAGGMPTDLVARHNLLLALAQRGPSEHTDRMARELYLSKDFRCVECLKELLEKQAVWDFTDRYEIYEKFRSLDASVALIPPRSKPNERLLAITEKINETNRYFPEETLVRARVLEEFANRIGANFQETKIIEMAKFAKDANVEALAYRFFSAFVEKLYYESKKHPEIMIEFIQFLRGEREDPPSALHEQFRYVSKERVRKQFQSLTPELRAVVVNPMLTPPRGIYENPAMRERLIELAIATTGEYKPHAKLVLEALLHATNKAASYQETLTLSFILAQGGKSGLTPGQSFSILLGSMGNTGASLAQKLYQRRLVPAEMLEDLAHFQENARNPDRIKVFRLAAQRLGIEEEVIDETFEMVSRLGDASAKVVIEVMYKDGRIDKQQARALKLLWEDFERSNEIDITKLGYMVDHLEEHGKDPGYRRLRSGLQAVKSSLERQADLSADSKNEKLMKELYDSGKIDKESGFRFVVVSQDKMAGIGKDFSHESMAGGVSLSSLEGQDRERTFEAIYRKEKKILLDSEAADGAALQFEKDRHRGNYRVDLKAKPPTVYIFDYPLVSTVSKAQRDALFHSMGLIAAGRFDEIPIGELVKTSDPRHIAWLKEEVQGAFFRQIQKKEFKAAEMLNDILAGMEGRGVPVRQELYDYLEALGNAEYYSAELPKVGGQARFMHDFTQTVRQSFDKSKYCGDYAKFAPKEEAPTSKPDSAKRKRRLGKD